MAMVHKNAYISKMHTTPEKILGFIEEMMLEQNRIEAETRGKRNAQANEAHLIAAAKSAALRDVLEHFNYEDYGDTPG